MKKLSTIFFLIVYFNANTAIAGLFDIQINDAGGLTASQSALFNDAENYWESVITGTQTTLDLTLTIDAQGSAIDGAGGILGSAGPTFGVTSGSFLYASDGIMQFDTADLSALEITGDLFDVILHEMAHVIGFGTLWSSSSAVGLPGYQEVYVNGSGQYTGAHGLAAYQAEFDPFATYVPVELDGGPGTADGHWDETWAGGKAELMTGFLDSPTFISNTTIASFGDLGYTYILPSSTVPEPGTWGLLLFGLGFLVQQRRRRQA